MQKKRVPVVSIVLFVFSLLFLAYTIWAAVYSFNYISDMVTQGQLVTAGVEFEIISFHMSNFGQYLTFSLLLFGIAWLLMVVSPEKKEMEEESFEAFEIDEPEPDILEEEQEA